MRITRMIMAGAAAASMLLTAACGGSRDNAGSWEEGEADMRYSMSAPAPAMEKIAVEEQASSAGQETAQQFMAYTFSIGLRLPQKAVDPIMQRHIAACREAGPRVCQVVSSNLYNEGEDVTTAYLTIRATPGWINVFLSTVEADAEGADGDITNRSVGSEDLTRPILDMDARLKSQIALRDRLMALLEREGAELGELIEVEREIARVTGEIESMDAQLKNMRLRVSMSVLNLSYETKRSAISSSRFNPLGAALSDFFFNVSAALAAVVTAFAYAVPWLALIGLLIFIWLRAIWPWVRQRRKKKVEPATEPAED